MTNLLSLTFPLYSAYTKGKEAFIVLVYTVSPNSWDQQRVKPSNIYSGCLNAMATKRSGVWKLIPFSFNKLDLEARVQPCTHVQIYICLNVCIQDMFIHNFAYARRNTHEIQYTWTCKIVIYTVHRQRFNEQIAIKIHKSNVRINFLWQTLKFKFTSLEYLRELWLGIICFIYILM